MTINDYCPLCTGHLCHVCGAPIDNYLWKSTKTCSSKCHSSYWKNYEKERHSIIRLHHNLHGSPLPKYLTRATGRPLGRPRKNDYLEMLIAHALMGSFAAVARQYGLSRSGVHRAINIAKKQYRRNSE